MEKAAEGWSAEDIEDRIPGPEAEPVFTLSFLLELPHCLRIDRSLFLVSEPGDPWPGWGHAAMASHARFSSLPQGSRPTYTIEIRQARVRAGLPLDAATRAFRDWDKGVVPPRYRLPRLLRLRAQALRGTRVSRSAAVVSQFLTVEDLPSDGDFLRHDFLFAQLNNSLELLNQYVTTLAAMTDEWHISSVSRLDIQKYVPFMIRADPRVGPWGVWHDVVHVFNAHPYVRADLPPQRPAPEVAMSAAAVHAYRAGAHPFFPFIELYQSAEHHLNCGRSSQAVIASCTATEVFINTLFRVVHAALHRDPEELTSMLNAPFRNQLVEHLPKLLKAPLRIEDGDSIAGRWWTDCYLLRNKVVHEGHKPDDSEALAAKRATGAFTRWLGQALADDERLEPLRRFTAPPPGYEFIREN